MNKLKKTTGRAMSMPGGLAVGAAVSATITLCGCLLLTGMVLKGAMRFDTIGYGIMVVLLLGAFLGAIAAQGRIKRRRILVCMLSGGVYYLMMLAVSALFFGGQYTGVGVTGLLILGGAGTAALTSGKGSRKVGHRKWTPSYQ